MLWTPSKMVAAVAMVSLMVVVVVVLLLAFQIAADDGAVAAWVVA